MPVLLPLLAGAASAGEPLATTTFASSTAPIKSSRGKVVYDLHCAACHGATGDGNGPAAVWLYPKPRNFAAGLFKIQSTPVGSLPTDDDLFKTITQGMPGSSMPAFNYLPEADRKAVVEYVKELTAAVDETGRRVSRFSSGSPAVPVTVPAEPAPTLDNLALGKEVYTKMQCAVCHGETGAGDGPQVPLLKDFSGLPIRPRDFNTGAFRGGHTGRDLYLRIINGLPGTPMVPYGNDVMTPEERWALVHYIQSLRRTDVAVNDILTPEDRRILVKRAQQLPSSPLDAAWDSMDPTRIPLNPLWPEPNPVYAVAVTAVHDGRRIAILCQWRDDTQEGAPIRVQDFQDAMALQFSLTGTTPFIGMGDAENPVNIWQWKSGWQLAANGAPQDVHDAYHSMHVDTYFQPERQFYTARAAGNVLSHTPGVSVEDANARGFGTFTSQAATGQNVSGNGVWQNHFWSVVFFRDLASNEPDDVKLTPGSSVPLAFAVWNGAQRDRNGRKVISNWYYLVIE